MGDLSLPGLGLKQEVWVASEEAFKSKQILVWESNKSQATTDRV